MVVMINRCQSLELFWRTNLVVLGFLLALVSIFCLLDDQLFILINRAAGCLRVDNPALFVSNYGFIIQKFFITVPLAGLYTFRKIGRDNFKKGINLLVILFFAFLAFYYIYNEAMGMAKETVQRPRLYLEFEARVISSMSTGFDYQSFPSGHASSSFFLF